MRKLLIIIIILLFSFQGRAQMWCPPGATWYYGAYAMYPQVNGYHKYEYTNDTIVNSLTYKKIKKTFTGFNPFYGAGITTKTENLLFMRESNNVIYYCNDTLYDFNASIGNTWLRNRTWLNFQLAAVCDAPRRKVTVLDTGHIVINTSNLKTLKLQYEYKWRETDTEPIKTYTVLICEKTGNITSTNDVSNGLLFEPGSCETVNAVIHPVASTGLRCYADNNFAPYSPPSYTNTCTYINTTNIFEIKSSNENILIYPQPANNILNLSSPLFSNKKVQVIINNTIGQMVLNTNIQFTNGSCQINVATLTKGFYLLKLTDEDLKTYTQKIIVE
jgi:hypothetical protein